MDANMKDIGPRITCMDRVYTLGLTVASTMVSIRTIRKMELVHSTGQMDASMPVVGRMASSMEKQISRQLTVSFVKVSGKKDDG